MVKSIENTKKIAIKIDEKININELISALRIFTIANLDLYFYLYNLPTKYISLIDKNNKNIIINNTNQLNTYSLYKDLIKEGMDFVISFDDISFINNLIKENNKMNNKDEIIKRGLFFKNKNDYLLISDFNRDYKEISEIEDTFISSFNILKRMKTLTNNNKKENKKIEINYLKIGDYKDQKIIDILSKSNEYKGEISFKDLFLTTSSFCLTDSLSLSIFIEVMEGINELDRVNKENRSNKSLIGEYFSKLVFSYQKMNVEDINYLLLKIKLVFNFTYLLFILPTNLKTNEYTKIFKLIKDLF